MSYEDRFKLLKWPTLSHCRTFLSLVELSLREQTINTINTNSMSNQQDLIVINTLFFVRIVKLWNELPGDIVEADSFQHFKSKLKLYFNILL